MKGEDMRNMIYIYCMGETYEMYIQQNDKDKFWKIKN